MIPSPAATEPRNDFAWRLGMGSTLTLGIVLVAWALTVDLPKVAGGFISDAATYYSLAHSLAEDFDFEYRAEDLSRVWREFPAGPEGIFLKKGRDVQGISVTGTPPFLEIEGGPDWDGARLYYAKSFIFPLVAAPFVWAFGTSGFLVLHALLMTICFACAYGFLAARSAPVPAMIFAAAFLLLSVAPVYMVQLMPDFFNLALVLIAYFFWCYKEAAAESTTTCIGRWRARWMIGPRSDIVAAVLLGMATFSKPTLGLVIAPLLALFAVRRQWIRGLVTGGVFGLVIAGLFAWNVAITGEWNYQGGERRTFYALQGSGIGGFPFQSERHTFETTGLARATDRVPVEVLTGRDAFFEVFRRNLGYFFLGRHTGFVPYFFPGAAAIALFLFSRHPRRLWQWLTLAAGLGSAVFLILYMPFTYSGGGGPVGNRYFLGVYPLFLFITPPLARLTSGLVTAGMSAVFTAPLVWNPFYVSFHPAEHTMKGPFRVLPVELTLLNDLPVNNHPRKVRQPLSGTPPVLAYFLDDNVYDREADAFWVRGESRADLVLRAPAVTEPGPGGEIIRPRTLPRVEVQLESGPVPNRVTIKTSVDTQVVDLPANDRRSVTVAMPAGAPYKPFPDLPTNYVYLMSIASESAFVPKFQVQMASGDFRYLGVHVRINPIYQ